jgi:flagellar biosynthesis component FlhA
MSDMIGLVIFLILVALQFFVKGKGTAKPETV